MLDERLADAARALGGLGIAFHLRRHRGTVDQHQQLIAEFVGVVGAGITAMAGEQPFSSKMVWVNADDRGTGPERVRLDAYVPYGSGIVDAGMDLGGVPWAINPLTAPRHTLERMVMALSPQLFAGDDQQEHADHSFSFDEDTGALIDKGKTGSFKEDVTYSPPGVGVEVQGYEFGRRGKLGNHPFELLWDPPMPRSASNQHDHAAAVETRFGGDAYALAAVHPFFDPSLGNDPETGEQLHYPLDGLDAAGAPTATGQAPPATIP